MPNANSSIVRRSQQGFTLIEVLIALLVMTIGLVGMAALHMTSLKNAHSSYYRSIASSVALDVEERIWQRAATVLDTPGQCLDAIDLGAISTQVLNQWRIAFSEDGEPVNAGRIGIPNLNLAFGDLAPDSKTRPRPEGGTWTDSWIDITLTVTWTETRFVDDPSTLERFDYSTRMPCVSQFAP